MSLMPQKTPRMPGQAPTQQGIDRKRKMAEALMNIGQQGTGLSGPWGAIASALAGGVAGWQQRKADQMQGSLDDERKRKLAEALVSASGGKVDPALAGSLPLDQQQGLLSKIVTDRATAKDPELKWTDVGNEVVGTNPVTGAVVTRVPKGVDPTQQLSNDTTRRGQDITRDTTVRGQDLTASTTRRGQDVTAATAARGQDIGAQTAAANRVTTERGQDITAGTARAAAANRPLTEYQSKAVGQLTRMQGAESKLQELQQAGFSPSYVDKGLSKLGNFAEPADYQQYKQAAGEFIAGILRLDSGAAVPEVEFDRYFKTYFPQPGDSQQVIEQKAQSRKRATDALRTGIGDAGKLVPDPSQPQPSTQLAANGALPQVPQVQAPPAALEALKANPQLADQFKAKFGYLPPGF